MDFQLIPGENFKQFIHDKTFKPYLSAESIREKVDELAARLSRDYAGKNPVFIAILNGAFIFAADLFKAIDFDAEISFIKLASYKGTKSTGQVITAIGMNKGRALGLVQSWVPLLVTSPM